MPTDGCIKKIQTKKQRSRTISGFFVAADGNDVCYGAAPATSKDCGASDAEALVFAIDVAQPQVHVRPNTLERLEGEGAAKVLGVGARRRQSKAEPVHGAPCGAVHWLRHHRAQQAAIVLPLVRAGR
ncbi:unnamed protein product [Ixodes pacificus]